MVQTHPACRITIFFQTAKLAGLRLQKQRCATLSSSTDNLFREVKELRIFFTVRAAAIIFFSTLASIFKVLGLELWS